MKKFIVRFTIITAVIAAFAAVFTISAWLDKTSGLDAAAASDDKYKALDTFSQALSIVNNSYVEPIEHKDVIYGAIKGMLQQLDPHSSFFTPEQFKTFQEGTSGSFGGLGITIQMRDDAITIISPIEDTPAFRAGIKPGDVIFMINNEPTAGMTLDAAVSKMRGEPGTKIKITILRKSEPEPIDYTLERAIIKIKSVKYSMTENNIGYIRLTQFQEDSSNEMTKALADLNKQGAKGFIIDLRNNGGGLLGEAIKLASIFLSSDKTVVFTKDRTGMETPYKTKKMSYKENDKPIVVIVNDYSASASEILAGALQDHERALILGTTTFGKASVQSIMELRDGSAVKLTTARYYTPKGRSIQGVGIVPDVEVGAGKIEFSDNKYVIKEKNLAGHLVGENEKKSETGGKSAGSNNKQEKGSSKSGKDMTIEETEKALAAVLPPNDDVQYRSALQLIKGMMAYGKTGK